MTDKSMMTDEGIQQLFTSMQSHHIKVNGLVVGVLVLCLVAFGFLFWHSQQAYERALGKAEEREAAYMKRLDESEKKWADSEKRNEELSARQQQVQTRIVYRDKQAEALKIEVTAPDRSAEKVADDVQTAYKFPPINFMGDNFTFSKRQVQVFVATKLDADRFSADLVDTQFQLGLEKQKTQALQSNFDDAKTKLKEANDVIAEYKKIAKKGFLRRAGDAALKIGLLVGGIYLGRHI